MTRICALFLLVVSDCFGQESTHAIKFSPFHLIGFYPTIQLAYERGLTDNFSLQGEVGYVLRYKSDDIEFKDKRGIKLKVEPRFHLLPDIYRERSSYIAGEIYLNAINFDRQEWRTECFDVECQNNYLQRYDYLVRYREMGFGFKYGFARYFDDFIVDLNCGWAVRFVDYKKPDLLRQFLEEESEWFEIPNERKRVGFMPLVGIRFGYRLQ